MNSKTTQTKSLIIFAVMLLLFGLPHKIKAFEGHPFFKDIKEAYKDSKLTYDSKAERVLYAKLSEPKGIFEPSGHGSDLPKPRNAEEEQIMVQTIEALHRQFFKKVKTGGQYCPVENIKNHLGQTPKERIGISSGGYYRLFVAYWTLNVKLEDNRQNNISKQGYGNVYYIDSLLRFVESNLAGAFFPSPGPMEIPEMQRRQGIQDLLQRFAPTLTIKELYEGADPQKAGWPVLK
jgi:hypothetical protein